MSRCPQRDTSPFPIQACDRDGLCPEHGRNRPGQCVTDPDGFEVRATEPAPPPSRSEVIAEAVIADSIRISPAHALPQDSAERKRTPLCTGLLDYFPDALRGASDLYHEPVVDEDLPNALLDNLSCRGLDSHTFYGTRHALDLLERELGGEGGDETGPISLGELFTTYPRAFAAVAQVSWHGNEKHNPGEPLHHARGKSMDHADCIIRHLLERGEFDGALRHSACMVWRWLALGQEELEAAGAPKARGAR